ncbi:hypothetical protein [Azospirillum sp.]|uniref:hypothetical protein n=1 Tax=Azospirillum sp. TaxID=34012 RepID=UPI003D72D983
MKTVSLALAAGAALLASACTYVEREPATVAVPAPTTSQTTTTTTAPLAGSSTTTVSPAPGQVIERSTTTTRTY